VFSFVMVNSEPYFSMEELSDPLVLLAHVIRSRHELDASLLKTSLAFEWGW
jgi:hypothetical protein